MNLPEPASILEKKAARLASRVEEIRRSARESDPERLALQTGATFQQCGPGQGRFQLAVWGEAITCSFPGLVARSRISGEPLDLLTQALLAYYFLTSDGTPQAGEWVSFSALPEGKFYTQAYEGYTGRALAKVFKGDLPAFEAAAQSSGGARRSLGDVSFRFQVFPRVSLLAVCWLGDEDFPTAYQVLFDRAVTHHLPTDGCAILGSTLTRRLIHAHQASQPHRGLKSP